MLQNDLTCMGPGSVAFRLESGAVLDLGGHTLTLTTSSPIAVECLGRCSVLGPGTLATTGAGPFGGGITSQAKGRVIVTGVDFDGFAIGISAPFARVSIADTTIVNSVVGADGRGIEVDGVTIAVQSQGSCISAFTGRIRGQNLALSGCGIGIQVGKAVDLTGLTWTGGLAGILTKRRVRLVDSSVTGGSIADIASGRLPRLINTTCDRSAQIDSAGNIQAISWGVCAND